MYNTHKYINHVRGRVFTLDTPSSTITKDCLRGLQCRSQGCFDILCLVEREIPNLFIYVVRRMGTPSLTSRISPTRNTLQDCVVMPVKGNLLPLTSTETPDICGNLAR